MMNMSWKYIIVQLTVTRNHSNIFNIKLHILYHRESQLFIILHEGNSIVHCCGYNINILKTYFLLLIIRTIFQHIKFLRLTNYKLSIYCSFYSLFQIFKHIIKQLCMTCMIQLDIVKGKSQPILLHAKIVSNIYDYLTQQTTL